MPPCVVGLDRPPVHVTSYARPVADANPQAGVEAGGTGASASTGGQGPLVSAESLWGITRAIGWLLAIGGAGLVVTGVPLIFLYRPHGLGWLRGAHNAMSMLFVGAATALVVVLFVGFVRRIRVPPGWVVGLGALLVATGGLVSGPLLAWDWLGLRAVTVGIDYRGVIDAMTEARFVIIDGTEVSRGAYAAWAVVHVLAVPLLAGAVAWIARRRTRSSP